MRLRYLWISLIRDLSGEVVCQQQVPFFISPRIETEQILDISIRLVDQQRSYTGMRVT